MEAFYNKKYKLDSSENFEPYMKALGKSVNVNSLSIILYSYSVINL